jgi:hypothetical protein
MGKVIPFPNSNTSPEFVRSEQERLENVKKYQIELCLSTSIELTYMLLDEIDARGISLKDSEQDLDQHLLMISESVKALMLKASGIRHPLHKITEQIVNKEEGTVFASAWKNSNVDLIE